MTDDIDLVGEHTSERRRGALSAETEELRGCWRIFFILVAVTVVGILGLIAYYYAFEWQPWRTRSERQAEQVADELADLPPIPDVIGATAALAVPELDDYREVLLFSATYHGVDLQDHDEYSPNDVVTMTNPPPNAPASFTVNVFLGEVPARPAGIEEGSYWFAHKDTITERGTFQCVQACHSVSFCESCHESRLRGADAPLLADPEAAPELARAVADATGVDAGNLIASYQGEGWYRVDFLIEDPGTLASEAEAARVAAVAALPVMFATEDDAEVVLVRWVDAGAQMPIVEIGLERTTYERLQWMSVTPEDIPWTVDRYVVSSGLE